tara:strand:+ start:271 stop:498 length:228 start_codon:yes stop_codon:yes gene_type:complete
MKNIFATIGWGILTFTFTMFSLAFISATAQMANDSNYDETIVIPVGGCFVIILIVLSLWSLIRTFKSFGSIFIPK